MSVRLLSRSPLYIAPAAAVGQLVFIVFFAIVALVPTAASPASLSAATGPAGRPGQCPPKSIGSELEPFSSSRHFPECEESAQFMSTGLVFETFTQHPTPEHFDTLCSLFQKWTVCIKSAAARCNITVPASSSVEAQFGRTKATLIRTCVERRNVTLANLACMATQSRDTNPLFNGCFITMQLRRKTNAANLCRIMTDYLYCEDRLMRSACGSAVADFALAASIEHQLSSPPSAHAQSDGTISASGSSSSEISAVEKQCRYDQSALMASNTAANSGPAPDTGMQYSMQCPPEFPTLVRICYKDFTRTRVVLFPTMPAVVKSTAVDTIQQWCSALQKYKECVAPVERMCPVGVKTIFAVSSEWNKILQLAIYTCDTAFANYTRYLTCYSNAVHHLPGTLGLCRQMFDRFPSRQQAYTYRCSPDTNESRVAMEEREKLIECYAMFFDKQCGTLAKQAILPLLRIHYSFDFSPPCAENDGGRSVVAPGAVVVAQQPAPDTSNSVAGSGSAAIGQLPTPSVSDSNCPCAQGPVQSPVVQPTTRATRSLPVVETPAPAETTPAPSRWSWRRSAGPPSPSHGETAPKLLAACCIFVILWSQLTLGTFETVRCVEDFDDDGRRRRRYVQKALCNR